ncbi:MAG: DUF4292 domain-containing protein [Bacteroidia bacterium]|nr:DUF4292 domain-containing protein [Bacteroidia bacterium]
MQKKALLYLILVSLVLQACTKKAVPLLTIEPKTVNIEEIDFEYFHGKARVNFRDNKKERDVRSTIRVRKDSIIWMNFSVVGVQGGKVLINKDSIVIVSTVDKEFYVFTYTELSDRFKFTINYDIIQAAFLGNPVVSRQASDIILEDPSFNILQQTRGPVSIKSYINAASTKVEKVEMTESNSNNSLTLNYSNFQQVGQKIFPYNGVINLFYKTAAGILSNTITFEYTKAEVGDRELRFPFNIPRKYERR